MDILRKKKNTPFAWLLTQFMITTCVMCTCVRQVSWITSEVAKSHLNTKCKHPPKTNPGHPKTTTENPPVGTESARRSSARVWPWRRPQKRFVRTRLGGALKSFRRHRADEIRSRRPCRPTAAGLKYGQAGRSSKFTYENDFVRPKYALVFELTLVCSVTEAVRASGATKTRQSASRRVGVVRTRSTIFPCNKTYVFVFFHALKADLKLFYGGGVR